MDPNAILDEIVRTLAFLSASKGADKARAILERELAVQALRDLADWLEKGGFAPGIG